MGATLRRGLQDLALRLRVRVNRIVGPRIGGRERPVFYDIDRTVPALRAIDREYDAIRAEALALLSRSAEIPRYHEVDPDQTSISGADERNWRTFFVHFRVRARTSRTASSRRAPRRPSAASRTCSRASSRSSSRASTCRRTTARPSTTCAITWASKCPRAPRP